MSTSAESRRRRAVCAALTPVLGESELIAALWLQHDSLRSEAVSDIIRYVDAVAERHGLDAATRKRLYAKIFDALRQPDEQLPLDPWPAMQATRPGAAVQAPPPPMSLPVTPSVPVIVPAPAQPLPPAVVRPAHELVFAALVRALLSIERQSHKPTDEDLALAWRDGLPGAKLSADLRATVSAALDAPLQATWLFEAPVAALSTLAHTFYVGLCEARGPVEADQILVQAVHQAEQLPAAREFPPTRFL